MAKRIFFDNQGRLRLLPWGFHLVEDLVPFYQMADDLKRNQLSKEAKLRLKWMDYYQKTKNVSLTCRHFGISRRIFYYWKERYNPYDLWSLENKDKTPKRKRQREITSEQELKIVSLRKQHIRYGKEKIARIYQNLYGEKISSRKVQKVIEKYKLYHHPLKTAKIAKKRKISLKRIGLFLKSAQELGLGQYFNRPRTPRDNPVNERFNRTLKEEFLLSDKLFKRAIAFPFFNVF